MFRTRRQLLEVDQYLGGYVGNPEVNDYNALTVLAYKIENAKTVEEVQEYSRQQMKLISLMAAFQKAGIYHGGN